MFTSTRGKLSLRVACKIGAGTRIVAVEEPFVHERILLARISWPGLRRRGKVEQDPTV